MFGPSLFSAAPRNHEDLSEELYDSSL